MRSLVIVLLFLVKNEALELINLEGLLVVDSVEEGIEVSSVEREESTKESLPFSLINDIVVIAVN